MAKAPVKVRQLKKTQLIMVKASCGTESLSFTYVSITAACANLMGNLTILPYCGGQPAILYFAVAMHR